MLTPDFVRQRAGRIINIASVAGLMGNPGQANYASAKAGLIGLTKTVAQELASRGVTVQRHRAGLCGNRYDPRNEPERAGSRHERGMPLGRMGEPEEIAAAARPSWRATTPLISPARSSTIDGGTVTC